MTKTPKAPVFVQVKTDLQKMHKLGFLAQFETSLETGPWPPTTAIFSDNCCQHQNGLLGNDQCQNGSPVGHRCQITKKIIEVIAGLRKFAQGRQRAARPGRCSAKLGLACGKGQNLMCCGAQHGAANDSMGRPRPPRFLPKISSLPAGQPMPRT